MPDPRSQTEGSVSLTRIEDWLLCGLLLVLPSLTSPKAAFLILIAGCVLLARKRELWQSLKAPDLIEWTLLALLLSGVLSAAWNWEGLRSVKGALDGATQVLVFWYCYRILPAPARERYGWMICLGTVLGLAYGAYRTAEGDVLSLYQLGTGPRSAIYLGVALFAAVGLVVHSRHRAVWARVFAGFCVLAFIFGLWLVASRAAILAVAIAFAVLFFKFRAKRVLVGLLGAAALTGYAAFALPNYFSQDRMLGKVHALVVQHQLAAADKERVMLWSEALEQIRSGQNIVFGVGLRKAASALKAQGTTHGHAHNLFLFKLAEQGIVGLLSFGAFLVVIGVRLLRSSARAHWLNVAAMGALLVPALSGLVGSPWIKEHAILAMIVLGLWAGHERLAATRSAPNSSRPLLS
jgi:O-antigen ligase